MIEILILYQLCKKIGAILRDKNRGPTGYQVLLVLIWFGTEFFSGIVACIVYMVMYGQKEEPPMLLMYAAALPTAALAVWLYFVIVKNLPQKAVETVN